jgi:sialic acid synthase SpsE
MPDTLIETVAAQLYGSYVVEQGFMQDKNAQQRAATLSLNAAETFVDQVRERAGGSRYNIR